MGWEIRQILTTACAHKLLGRQQNIESRLILYGEGFLDKMMSTLRIK